MLFLLLLLLFNIVAGLVLVVVVAHIIIVVGVIFLNKTWMDTSNRTQLNASYEVLRLMPDPASNEAKRRARSARRFLGRFSKEKKA